jgi:uncharacterized protein YraI
MPKIAITTTLAALVLAPTPAMARTYSGWAVRTTMMRAGPDYDYPPVQRIGRNAQVVIFGCLNDWSWCDVGYRYDRGWVEGRDLVANYRGRRQGISSYLGIGILSFIFGNYWDSHYRGRPFYNERSRWEQRYYTNYQPHWGPRPNIPQVYQNRNPLNVPMQRQRSTATPQVQQMPERNRNMPAFNRNRGNIVTVPQPNAGPRPTSPPVDQNRARGNVNVQRPQRGTFAPQAQPAPDRHHKVREVTQNQGNQASTPARVAAPQAPARQRGNPDNKGNKGNKKDKQGDQPKPPQG